MTENTRTVVTVVPLTLPVIDVGGTMRNTDPVRYEGADDFDTTDGELIIWRAKHGCAIWAPGTWARVEITEEPAALQLTDAGYTAESLTFAADVIVGVTGGELEPGPIADLVDQLRHDADADAEPAEPEEPAGPGTFEVYQDNAGKYRWRLDGGTGTGEVLATGQAYATRRGAHDAIAAVQRAAKDAPIVDVEGYR